MTTRKIVQIDEEKCDGCGECVPSCEEGAIQVIDGKARLTADVYCDGLGACLGHCPQDAISMAEREADPFDEVAVARHLEAIRTPAAPVAHSGGCPGSKAMQIQPSSVGRDDEPQQTQPSGLVNWPIQLKLVPPNAPYFQEADLLLVADCVPLAYADFHRRFLDGRPVVVGCPKLDDGQFYVQKLAQIIQMSNVRSIHVLVMEVPCCTGLERIAQAAISLAGADTELNAVTVSVRGEILQPGAVGPPVQVSCPH